MGQSSSSTGSGILKCKEGTENLPQYGSVLVKISWLGNNRRQQDRQNSHTVSARGSLFHGSSCNTQHLIQAIEDCNKYVPKDVVLADSRAHQLLVIYSDGWYAIPSLEIFSRHSGTCVVIGDRKSQGKPYPIKLGDCFRLGSVGLVVSEMKLAGGIEKRLDMKRLQYLREEALAFDNDQEEACLAAMENDDRDKNEGAAGAPQMNGERDRFCCYMCYESHDLPTDQLVAPCDCKGDTRYLHVQCLQKWYQSSVCGPRAQVIRTTGNGAPACKICGVAYKTAFRNTDGKKVSLLETDSSGPYLSMVVVTKHDTSPSLFNTKFRLNFGVLNQDTANLNTDPPGTMTVGRSSACNMILDYRTVSTVHAKLFFQNNEFFIQDSRSSNGTMAYIQGPLPLHYSRATRVRMGRSTLQLQARHNWSASLRSVFSRPVTQRPPQADAQQLFSIMSSAAMTGSVRLRDRDRPDTTPLVAEDLVSPPVDESIEEEKVNSTSRRILSAPTAGSSSSNMEMRILTSSPGRRYGDESLLERSMSREALATSSPTDHPTIHIPTVTVPRRPASATVHEHDDDMGPNSGLALGPRSGSAFMDHSSPSPTPSENVLSHEERLAQSWREPIDEDVSGFGPEHEQARTQVRMHSIVIDEENGVDDEEGANIAAAASAPTGRAVAAPIPTATSEA